MLITANRLKNGQFIDKVTGNPAIRGVVKSVNRFANEQANRDKRSPIGELKQAKGSINRIIAKEEKDCYSSSANERIAIAIGCKTFTLQADTEVSVYMPATQAMQLI